MAQYFQIVQNVDELKRICPNINLERLQVVSVSGDEVGTLNQQIILAPDDQLVLNDNQVSQIVYQQQQPQQQVQAQRGATHFIIQDEDNSSATQQQQIYYSSETESDQITQQHQQNQMVQTTQQQVVLRHVTAANSQQQQHQQLLVHKTHDPNTRQQVSTPVLMDQSQSSGHAHVIVQQQSPQLVLQPQHQQTAVQTQGNAAQAPQTSQIVMRQQVPGSNLGQQRIIYTNPPRTVVFTQPIQQQLQQQQQQQQHALQHHADTQSNQTQTAEATTQHRVIRQTNVQHHSPIQNIIFTPVQSPQNQGQQIQQQSPPQNQQNQQSQTQHLTPQHQPPIRGPQASRISQNRMILNPRFPHQSRQNIRLNIVPQSSNATPAPPTAPATPQTKPTRGRQGTGRGRGGRGGRHTSAQSKAAKASACASIANTGVSQVSTANVQTQATTVQTQQTQATSAASRIYSSQATQAAIQQHRLIASQVHQRLIGPQRSQMPTPNIIANFTQQNQPRFRAHPTISAKIVNTNYPSSSDIEESIQAVVVTKSIDTASSSVTSTATSEPKSHLNTTLTSYYSDNPDEKKEIQLQNGRVMSLAEYKRMHKQSKPLKAMQSANRTNTIPVNRVAPMQAAAINKTVPPPPPMISEESRMQRLPVVTQTQTQTPPQIQQQPQHIVHAPRNQLQIQEGDTQKSARMLVILSTGEQRLITFTLPKESCTVQELLEQVGVPFTSKTNINCVSNPGANIDYVVSVGMAVPESTSELISAAEQTLQLSKQQIMDPPVQQMPDPSPQQQQSHSQSLTGQPMQIEKLPVETKEVSAKIIQGFLAVCQSCGYSGNDHAKCERCRRVFHEEPKRVPYSKNFANKMDEERKRQTFQAEIMNKAASKAIASVTSHRGRGGLSAIRGRGRGVPRSKPEPVEPVILTLSSDEEDDEKSNQSVKTPPANISGFEQAPLPCEPIIPEDDGFLNYNRENVADVANVSDKQLVASLTCRLIRIGTHRYEPREKVLFTTKGVKIVAPNCANPDENVVLNIQTREIVKIVAHFSKGLPILFIYTLPRCGKYIRESLDMKPKDSTGENVYYNPTDRSEPNKRIVLQMDSISEDSKSVIKAIFATTVLEEIPCNDANELLLRACAKDKKIKNESGSAAPKIESTDIRQILIYPPGKGGISVNTEDYMCLAIDQYLNDIIIDFYLKYLHTNVLSEDQRDKTHIFSSFFYKRLTTMTSRQRHNEKDVKLTAAQKRHARVKSWTKNVNLFEKDFIIIPINEQSHWFLSIICFPKLKGPVNFDTMEPVNLEPNNPKKKKSASGKVSQIQIGNTTITPLSKRDLDSVCVGDDSMSERDEAEGDESDLASADESDAESNATPETNEEQHQRIKQPLILIFDSLSGASRSRVVATLRDYLTCEYKAKIKEDSLHSFTKWNMPGQCVKVPQQNNFTDCGLYLLQYVEHFFKDPIRDYRLPIKQLVNWFETIVVTRKREEISNLLRDLVEQLNPEKLPLPDIAFPTINGKLVEQDDSFIDEQAEFEEEEMEDEFEEEDDEELGGDTEGEASPEKVQNGSGQRSRDVLKRPLEAHVLDNSVRKTAKLEHIV